MVFLYIGLTICVVLLFLSLIIFKWEAIKKFFSTHFHKKDSGKKSKKNANGGKLRAAETQFRPIVKPPEDKTEKKNLDAIDTLDYKPEVDKLKDFSRLSKSSKNSIKIK